MNNPINHILLVASAPGALAAAREAFNAVVPPIPTSCVETLAAAREVMEQYVVDMVIGEAVVRDGALRGLLDFMPYEQAPPVIILVNDLSDPEIDVALAEGVWDYLLNVPGTLHDLPHLAERSLSTWRLHQHLEIAEAELANSESRLQALTGSTSDFVWEVDANAIYTYVSPQVQSMLGYSPSELLGRSVYDFMTGPEAERQVTRFQQIMASRRPLSRWQNAVLNKQGRQVILETSGVPIVDGEGQFHGFRGIDRDITQRSQSEQILRRREAILQAVAQAAQDLLQSTSSSLHIQPALDRLGIAAEVSRVYVFSNTEDEQGQLVMNQMYEWVAEGVEPQINNPELQQLPYTGGFEKWRAHLQQQHPVHGNVAEFSEHEQTILEPQGVRSILVVPIFVQDDWWGFIGFDECEREREWSKGEIDALTTAARILGAALQRRQWEAKIGQLNDCFLHFGPDPMVNINHVTELCGLLFGASSAFYHRQNGNALHTWGHWNQPADYPSSQPPRGHICNDVIQKGGELHVPDLQETFYMDTDHYVREYQMRSFFGRAVRYRGRPVGAICALFQQSFWPTENDRKLLAIMASAIGVEEERRAAEGELKRLATTIEQAAESICITDLDGRVEYVNPAFERTSGYSADQLIGQAMPFFRAHTESDEFYESIWRTLRAGEVWSSRIMTQRQDGSPLHEDAIMSPIRDPNGQIVNYVAVKRDITKEMELEEQLRHSQKMESIGRLAGGVAHDFNNLLSVILGYADMALANVTEDEPLHEMLHEIRDAGQRASALTNQLLAFSRKQVLEMKSVNLSKVIEEMRKMLGRLIGEDMELVTILEPQLDAIRADVSQLQQILMNLVVNARDAMPRDGRITIETRNLVLSRGDVRLTPGLEPGPYVKLTVTDTGHGMDAETKLRIFDPFYTTKSRGKGTGLGLATVHGIVQQHGGNIVVDSTVGEGSVFSIFLPSDMSQKEAGNTTILEELDPHGDETIVVVEDDHNVLSLARRILERYGYSVLAAKSGEDALEQCARHQGPLHLVLTDVVMPRMNGREVYEQLLVAHPQLRVLYMSGYAETAIFSRGIIKEGVPLIGKPFTVSGLTSAIRDTLDG